MKNLIFILLASMLIIGHKSTLAQSSLFSADIMKKVKTQDSLDQIQASNAPIETILEFCYKHTQISFNQMLDIYKNPSTKTNEKQLEKLRKFYSQNFRSDERLNELLKQSNNWINPWIPNDNLPPN